MKPSLTPYLLIITLIGASFLLLAVLVSSGAIQGTDEKILAYLADFRSPVFDRSFYIVTWVGSLYLLIPTGVIIVFLLYRKNFKTEVLLIISSFTAAILFCRLIKYFTARERPDVSSSLIETTGYAFPSCHATQASAFFLLLYMVTRSISPRNSTVVAVVLGFSTLLVLVSRVYLQVHYPTDVIGGLLLGLVCVLGFKFLLRR